MHASGWEVFIYFNSKGLSTEAIVPKFSSGVLISNPSRYHAIGGACKTTMEAKLVILLTWRDSKNDACTQKKNQIVPIRADWTAF